MKRALFSSSIWKQMTSLRSLQIPSSASFFPKLTSPNMTVYTEKYIEQQISEKLEATHVKAIDESDGCGGKFHVTVVSSKFEGKGLLQRHRLVNSALVDELKSIHAFSQKTFTPQEWEKQQQE